MFVATISGYHQIYQSGLIVTIVLFSITVILFFAFRVYKIINDMTGATKRKELKLREAGVSTVKKKSVKEKNGKQSSKTSKAEKKSARGAKARTSGNAPTEVLNAPGSAPTEVLNMPGSAPTEVLNASEGIGITEKIGATAQLGSVPPVGEISIAIIQEIMYIHSDEIIMV